MIYWRRCIYYYYVFAEGGVYTYTRIRMCNTRLSVNSEDIETAVIISEYKY